MSPVAQARDTRHWLLPLMTPSMVGKPDERAVRIVVAVSRFLQFQKAPGLVPWGSRVIV
jgi:hypothetical protein